MSKLNTAKNVTIVLKELEARSRISYKNMDKDSAAAWGMLCEANAFQTACRLLTDSEYFKEFIHELYD